ncbi:peptidoglycan DD-metalloendopeptidase family protein [Janibacter melonis]|uniref:peptidoglycan DD-metalloendopeptidase family protein n=1 Tax=Janibacter melonis TaxID=262209 RepID=UPI002043F25C|nr:peptidoglycan DD-metalloendopeptidase family protein [Janibacter melonis]MCM3556666.1 peptidoglycan DD-metalloendopeptidase family protein [Janibacter melonis]
MKKLAFVLVPVLAFFAVPLGLMLMVTSVSVPAAAEELRAVECEGAVPATGQWRPPYQQRYSVSARGFGNEFHPIHHEWRMHSGQDLVSLPGPGPVVAIGDGRVKFAGLMGGYGNVVDLEHEGGTVSRYAHLANLDVRQGQSVAAGTTLGTEGTTGLSTGNHLHFEIHVDGAPVDPVPFMLERGAPLNGKAVARSQGPSAKTAPADVAEGGVLPFELPQPRSARQDSLHNKPLSIPPDLKRLYVAAGKRYKVPWTLLAGIGMEETAHGRNTATSSAGAQGLMQFMPATFATMGVDGDGDGRTDIHNDADSVYSAANYLVRSGVTKGPEGVFDALWAYNQADWYASDVLYYAKAYGGGHVLGGGESCGSTPGDGNPDLPPLTDERTEEALSWATTQIGDDYRMGANGPNAWDCSSFTQAAFARIGVTLPRTAQDQRDWLAKGNGRRVQPGQEKPGDLIFYDSYRGPSQIGHVAIVWDPAAKKTVEASSPSQGVGHFSYAGKAETKTIFEIWRIGNVSDSPTTQS